MKSISPSRLLATACLGCSPWAQSAWAQPAEVPSTIKKLPTNTPAMGVPVLVPDPPLISPAELQKLTGGPSLVTFSGRDVPAKEIIQTLRDAAHLPESDGSTVRLKPVTVDWMNVPFWIAAREVEKQSGGSWSTAFNAGLFLTASSAMPVMRDFFGGTGGGAPSLSGLAAAQTPFATLVANSLSRTAIRAVRLGDEEAPLPAATDRIQLFLTAYFDPKLTVRSVELRDLKFQQREDAPNPTNPFTAVMGGTKFSFRGDSNLVSQQVVQIPPAFTAGTKMARIGGILHSVLVTATETWNVPDLLAAAAATRAIGAGQYTFEKAEIKDGQLMVHLSTQAGVAPQTGNAAFTSVQLRGAQGNEIPGRALQIGSQKADFGFILDEAIPGPYSLEWKITTQTKSLDVPFELRDVVLP